MNLSSHPPPFLTPVITIFPVFQPVTRVIDTLIAANINGVNYKLYKLQSDAPGTVLAGGTTWWISAGINGNGSLNGRSLFAYSSALCRPCPILISPGVTRMLTPVPQVEWQPGTRDYAFRVCIHEEEEPTMDGPLANPAPPTCKADFDRSGTVTIDDIFLFLNAWLVGCP